MDDYYSVLGVDRDASQEEIQQAYRKKAKEYHPDISDHDDAEERFKQVKKAYETLSDESKKQQYDRMGHRAYERADKHGATGEGGPGGAGGMGGMGGMGGFGGAGGFGDLGDVFDAFFGGGGRSGPSQGRDLQTDVTIDLEDAFEGTTETITYPRRKECPECGGSGAASPDAVKTCPECSGTGRTERMVNTPQGRMMAQSTCERCNGEGEIIETPCPECNGRGRVRENTTVEVEIPAGIKEGQRLTLRGKGEAGEKGAPPGDLYVQVRIRDHPRFERKGDDLLYVQPVTYPQAVFGDTVRIQGMDGELDVDIPSGIQSGKTLRINGKGMPRLNGRGRGDLHVTVQIVTPEPTDLEADAIEALEDYADATGDEVELDEGILDRIKKRVLG